MKQFYMNIDKRNKKQMISYLENHYRYFTANSWNISTSYANNLKIHTLGLENSIESKLYDMIDTDGFYDSINDLIHDFAAGYDHRWQAGFNGRSGGYLVLYSGGKELSGYKSHCIKCGQLNFKQVPPSEDTIENRIIKMTNIKNFWTETNILQSCKDNLPDLHLSDDAILDIIRKEKQRIKSSGEYTESNKCGRCGNMSRVNFTKPHYRIVTNPGRSLDADEDFTEWDLATLRDRVELVQDFDKLCDSIVSEAIYLSENFDITEEEYFVSKTRKVLVEAV